jgi:ABC-type multidrug transport system permease subunit
VSSPFLELTKARCREFYREPSAMFWTFGFPLILSIALGIAFRDRKPEPSDVAIEQIAGSDVLAAALSSDAGLHETMLPPADAEAALRSGKVALVVIPGAPVTYRFDPMRPESRLARAQVDDAIQAAAGRKDATITADQPVTEPGSRYIDFLIPGLIGMNLMSGGMWAVGYVLVEMRTRKLMKRLMATPMRRSHFLGAFLAMRALVLAVELPIMLGFAYFVFRVPLRGSIVLLVGLAALGSLAFAGLGLLVASRATNTQTANGLMQLVMMPMFVCSGVFFSSSHFPDAAQPLIRALPLTALNDSMRAVMIDGAGITQVALPTLVLAGWGFVAFVAALRLFRWR